MKQPKHKKAQKCLPSRLLQAQGMRKLLLSVAITSGAAVAQVTSHAPDTALMAQLHEAIITAQRGNPGKAMQMTQALLASHPNFAPALEFKGAVLEATGHRQEAAESYKAALKLEPNDKDLLLKVGIIELIAGDKSVAIELFQRRLKLLPRDADTLYYLAQAYHLKGENDLALKTIAECVKVDPENAAVQQKYGELLSSSGDNDGGLRWLLKAKQADATLDRIDLDLGIASLKSMDLTNALDYAKKATQANPRDLNALALLAAVNVKLGNCQDAAPAFQTILAVKADDPTSLLGLGHCDLELKQYDQSAGMLQRLLQEDPTQVLAHFYLSKAYMALGRPADAQHEADLHSRMLEQASSALPEGDTEKENVIWHQAREMLNKGDEADAVQLFKKESKGPFAGPGGPYVLLGVLYLYLNRIDDSSRALHKALTLEPAIQGANTYLAKLSLSQNELDKAEAELKAELAEHANYQEAIAEFGELRYRQGRWAEAADQIAKSKTTNPSMLYMLCDSYFRLGKVKDADLTAELMIDYSKSDPDVVQGVIDLLKRNQQDELASRLASKTHT